MAKHFTSCTAEVGEVGLAWSGQSVSTLSLDPFLLIGAGEALHTLHMLINVTSSEG